jgi:1,4-dihydroxy-2-naphthoyl-CoA hydrolase
MAVFAGRPTRPAPRHANCSVPPVTSLQLGTYPTPGTLDDVLGFELLEASAEHCRARVPADRCVQPPAGLVHGGTYAALAESMVSLTTHAVVSENGELALGQSNHTTFLRPVTGGHVNGEARVRHRGRTSWIWDVEFTDDDGRLSAITRVILAVRRGPY